MGWGGRLRRIGQRDGPHCVATWTHDSVFNGNRATDLNNMTTSTLKGWMKEQRKAASPRQPHLNWLQLVTQTGFGTGSQEVC